MRVSILLQITDGDGTTSAATEVVAFEKATERVEDVGLPLADGKALLAAVQYPVVKAQADTWTGRHRCCKACGARRRCNGSYPILFRTLYGDVRLASPRLHRCVCKEGVGPVTVSPLQRLILGHVAPERLHLEARWASLVPYAAAAGLLADVLPIASGANVTMLRRRVLRVAERAEADLGEEQVSFVEGCPARWAKLPIPEGRITIGLDGGYVRNWMDRKANFELIVGRSVPDDRAPRSLGLVHGYDQKPKRRLFELLKAQGAASQSGRDIPDRRRGGGARPDRVGGRRKPSTSQTGFTSPCASRCSGPGAAPTCCCKPAPAPSTARSGRCSSGGIQGWPTTTRPVPVKPQRRESPTLSHGSLLGSVSSSICHHPGSA